MRILVHLIDSELAGGQRVAADVAAALHARGHEIGVLVPRTGPALTPFAALDARTHVLDLASLRRPWRVAAGARIMRDYDVLYSHTSAPGEILGSIAAHLAGRSQVVHRHSYLDVSSRRRVGAVQRALYRLAVHRRPFIAVADHIRTELIRSGVDPHNVTVIPNGTWIGGLPSPRAAASPPLRIGMLGRVEPVKGGDLFVRAAALSELGQPTEWIMAGPPGPDRAYESRIRAAAASNGVTVLGRVDPGTDYLASLDIVVVPSRFEGHPLVVLEAFALGLAVVATEIDGIREVVEQGSGLLVAPEDAKALADGIALLAADEGLRKRLGARARALAVERYDVRRTVEQAVEVIEARAPVRSRSETPS